MADLLTGKDIILVGTGHVATVLGRLFRARGYRILQVYGRNLASTMELATELGAEALLTPSGIFQKAGLCLVAVTDAALYSLPDWMPKLSCPVAHTAGSVPMEVLSGISGQYGVLYPLQSLRKNQAEIPEIPFLVQGSDKETEHLLRAFARGLSGNVHHASEDDRRRIHLAAVFTSNFFNHLCTLTHEYCQEEGIDFQMLLPLLKETVDRMETEHPGDLQTGPAARGDQPTIDRHLSMLDSRPGMQIIYKLMSESIRRQNQKSEA